MSGKVFATHMDSLQQKLENLATEGYRESFILTESGWLRHDDNLISPTEFAVDKTVQTEGASNPADEAAVFAGVASKTDGDVTRVTRGVIVLPADPNADQSDAIRSMALAGRRNAMS